MSVLYSACFPMEFEGVGISINCANLYLINILPNLLSRYVNDAHSGRQNCFFRAIYSLLKIIIELENYWIVWHYYQRFNLRRINYKINLTIDCIIYINYLFILSKTIRSTKSIDQECFSFTYLLGIQNLLIFILHFIFILSIAIVTVADVSIYLKN